MIAKLDLPPALRARLRELHHLRGQDQPSSSPSGVAMAASTSNQKKKPYGQDAFRWPSDSACNWSMRRWNDASTSSSRLWGGSPLMADRKSPCR